MSNTRPVSYPRRMALDSGVTGEHIRLAIKRLKAIKRTEGALDTLTDVAPQRVIAHCVEELLCSVSDAPLWRQTKRVGTAALAIEQGEKWLKKSVGKPR